MRKSTKSQWRNALTPLEEPAGKGIRDTHSSCVRQRVASDVNTFVDRASFICHSTSAWRRDTSYRCPTLPVISITFTLASWRSRALSSRHPVSLFLSLWNKRTVFPQRATPRYLAPRVVPSESKRRRSNHGPRWTRVDNRHLSSRESSSAIAPPATAREVRREVARATREIVDFDDSSRW